MSKRAVITGILGMDASTLAEYLLELGYDCYGIYRHASTGNNFSNIESIINHPRLHLMTGDICDASFINKTMLDLKPDEWYGLAAQSFVHESFKTPLETFRTDANAVLFQLEAIRLLSPKTRFYNSGSSEVYGGINCPENGYDENSPHYPKSPYGCAKSVSIHLTRNYREAYGLHASSGLLFNHSFPGKRSKSFFSRKLTLAMASIKLGLQDVMKCGNLDSFRDEGSSSDYTRAQHLILQQERGDEYIVSTGSGATMKEMLEYVCEIAGLDSTKVYRQVPEFMRPSEVNRLLGNASKIRALGWEPKYDWKRLLKEMYEYDLNMLTKQIQSGAKC